MDWHVINPKTKGLNPELACQKLNLKSSVFENYSTPPMKGSTVYVSQCLNVSQGAELAWTSPGSYSRGPPGRVGRPRMPSGTRGM